MKYQAILTEEAALEAVTKNGFALRFVKDQTEEVVLAAVTKTGDALQFVLCKDLFIKVAAALNITVEE